MKAQTEGEGWKKGGWEMRHAVNEKTDGRRKVLRRGM